MKKIVFLCLPVIMGIAACSSSKSTASNGNTSSAATATATANPVNNTTPPPANSRYAQPVQSNVQHTSGRQTASQ